MTLSPVLFIPHGGGPLPLLGDKNHTKLNQFLTEIPQQFPKPSTILVISAHWEADIPNITSGLSPSLIYDYYGFPDETYEIQYPAPGAPKTADLIYQLLNDSGIDATLDDQRGFDHGLFVPLKLMYPDADIPCLQLSLVNTLDAELHIRIGKALAPLRNENILILGSGFSFHNLSAMLKSGSGQTDPDNESFEQWLIEACTRSTLNENERSKRLIEWKQAPAARYCHPREEHLLPLHVCYGVSQSAARLVFYEKVLGKKTSAFLW